MPRRPFPGASAPRHAAPRHSPRPASPGAPRTLLAGLLAATATAGALVAIPVASAQEAGLTTSPAFVEATPSATPTATTGPSPTPSPAPSPSPSATATATVALLRLTTSVPLVVAGGNVTLNIAATTREGAPLPGEALQVVARVGGTRTSTVVGTVRTGGDGRAALAYKPRTSNEYLVRRVAAPAASSNRRVVELQPRLSARVVPGAVTVGSAATLTGSLAPAYSGTRLLVQRRTASGAWQSVAVVTANGSGSYSYVFRPGVPGRVVLRTVLTPTLAYRGVTTAPVALTVLEDPTLRQGQRGNSVRVLEQRLAALKADVGAIDGFFDQDLRHALTSFQKSQGLPRTGTYDARTRARMANPLPVRLRFPSAGRAVEIDLTKQVLYLSEGGVLRRMVDISSGNDRPYVSDGVTYKAFTPTGRFRVTRKIDGVRVSRLGELYRPAYFVQGWAIHGSPSVPAYPASHGCIRVTNSSQDRLFPLLPVGTPVSVFRG